MRECQDRTIQEALPGFVRGALEVDAADAVRAHLAQCEACAAEMRLVAAAREVIDRATPAIDVARIAAAVTPGARGAVPSATPPIVPPRVITLRTRRWWASRQLLAAAASILVVVSLSLPALRGSGEGTATAGRLDSVGAVAAAAPTGGDAAIDLAGGLAELSSAQLQTLLDELDRVEGTVRADPATVALPLLDAPESL